jgi:septum formation protein
MIRLPAGQRLVLASSSPRRAALLRSAGLEFEIEPADVDETPLPGEEPDAYVARVAHDKAAAIARAGCLVLAADTTVDAGGEILAKPVDDADARRMLRLLSGDTHFVHSGVVVIGDGVARSQVVTTEVQFVDLTAEAIDWYVSTGEASDKAGAYAIQGRAAAFVESLNGSVTNVVGLPLAQTLALLAP